jgi:hypothetical protein
VFWVMVTAIASAVLVVVAWSQLRSLAKTSRSDFLYKLKKDFFTDEARRLVFLFEQELLEFQPGDMPYFKIVARDQAGVGARMKELGIGGHSISTYAVDDALLGPMEDLGVLEELGLVNLREVYEVFVTYINICVESKSMRAYLDYCRRDPGDEDVYDNLLRLYERLRRATPSIRRKKRRKSVGKFGWPV